MRTEAAFDAPLSTYRLQLGGEIDFAAAADLLEYLDALGVTHLYLSPILTARTGSTHGYDVADPERVATALGGEEGLRALAGAARARGMGLVVDIVPNHIGIGADNPLWQSLLAEGSGGQAAQAFDVDWDSPLPGAAGKVVLPVLGDPYGQVLEAGELHVVDEDGQLRLRYHEHTFPIAARSSEAITRSGVDQFVGVPGQPQTWGRLHALLEEQHYRLVHWVVGDALVNYRRFFAVSELAAVRVELEPVFDIVHSTILRLVAEGVIAGLRVDHVDGLADPAGYVERLAARTGGAWTVVEKILAPGEDLPSWPAAGGTGYDFLGDVLGLFVDPVSETALTETARSFGAWPPDLHAAARAAKAEMLDTLLASDCERLTRRFWVLCQTDLRARDVDARTCRCALVAAIAALDVYRTYTVPGREASRQDVGRVETALATAALDAPEVPPEIWALLGDVLCGRGDPRVGGETRRVSSADSATGEGRGADPVNVGVRDEVLRRFQQLSGAVMAKGVEDTLLYRQHRLLAVNEVGVEPEPLGLDVVGFHAANARRAGRHPTGMLTTSTHDTKRGEDVRLRIAALSELAGEWTRLVAGWRSRYAEEVTLTAGGPAPDPATEYLLYQTLVGVWPPSGGRERLGELRERVAAYARKATREAALRTTWGHPDDAFEAGVAGFLDALLVDGSGFVDELESFATRTNEIAMVASLAQTLLRCTSPGVPDTYQGTELWVDDLVDPDNRRSVDFAARVEALAGLEGERPGGLLAARHDGRVKLWVLSRALRTRREHPATFGADGAYVPLEVTGRWAEHVVAFARVAPDGGAAVTIAPRLPGAVMVGRDRPPLGEDWADTTVTLPEAASWSDALGGPGAATGTRAGLSQVLLVLPVALLSAP